MQDAFISSLLQLACCHAPSWNQTLVQSEHLCRAILRCGLNTSLVEFHEICSFTRGGLTPCSSVTAPCRVCSDCMRLRNTCSVEATGTGRTAGLAGGCADVRLYSFGYPTLSLCTHCSELSRWCDSSKLYSTRTGLQVEFQHAQAAASATHPLVSKVRSRVWQKYGAHWVQVVQRTLLCALKPSWARLSCAVTPGVGLGLISVSIISNIRTLHLLLVFV